MLHTCRIKLQLQRSRNGNFEISFYIFYLSVGQTMLNSSVLAWSLERIRPTINNTTLASWLTFTPSSARQMKHF